MGTRIPALTPALAVLAAVLLGVAPAHATQPPRRPAPRPLAVVPVQPGEPALEDALTVPVQVPHFPGHRGHATGPGSATEDCGGTNTRYEVLFLRAIVNDLDSRKTFVFLRRPCGTLLARVDDLEKLRIKTKGQPRASLDGEPWINLNLFPSLTYRVDEAAEALRLEGEPQVFYPTRFSLRDDRIFRPGPAEWGAVLNYGLTQVGVIGESGNVRFGSAGLVLFGAPGSLRSDHFYLDSNNRAQFYRFNTTFTRDFPEHITTLRAGDLFASAGQWGGGGVIGGLQYARNYATRPNYQLSPVTFMEAATRRVAAVGLATTGLEQPPPPFDEGNPFSYALLGNAPHGPVEVSDLPVYQNGAYHLRVRDRLGREQIVTQQFYFSQGLLRQGEYDFSHEGGLLRTGFFTDAYARGYLGTTHRYGLTNHITLEGHGEGTRDRRALGVSSTFGLRRFGLATLTHARSQDRSGASGGYGSVTLENRFPGIGVALRHDRASRQFGLAAQTEPLGIRYVSIAAFTLALPWRDSVGFGFTDGSTFNNGDRRSLRLSYSLNTRLGISFNLSAGYASLPRSDYSLGFFTNFALSRLWKGPRTGTVPLREADFFDPRRTYIGTSLNDGSRQSLGGSVRVATNRFREGESQSLQLTTGVQPGSPITLSGSWSAPRFNGTASLSRVNGASTYAVGASGALVMQDGGVFLSRPVDGSYAVVRLGRDNAGVRVNGLASNANGDVVVTNLQPYYPNRLIISAQDLPMNVRVDGLEFDAVPRFASGVTLRPDIAVVSDALVTVVLKTPDGRTVPLPEGAYAKIEGDDETYPAGTDGVVYLVGLKRDNRVRFYWRGRSCALTIPLPEKPGEETPELGPLLCEGVLP